MEKVRRRTRVRCEIRLLQRPTLRPLSLNSVPGRCEADIPVGGFLTITNGRFIIDLQERTNSNNCLRCRSDPILFEYPEPPPPSLKYVPPPFL